MSWLQLELPATAVTLAQAEDALLQHGAVAITLLSDTGEPILEPAPGETPLWSQCRVRALLPVDVDLAALREQLVAVCAVDPTRLQVEFVGDDDWQSRSANQAIEQTFADRLRLRPKPADSSEYPPQQAGLEPFSLYLDPGLAFGSGSHPTTRLCLEWIAANVLAGQRVLDFGCGSGVLGIGAALLGANVTAVDHDPQAVMATRENAAYNGIEQHRLVVVPASEWSPASHAAKFDVVVANILAGPLGDLAEAFEKVCKPGGAIVLSGVLQQQTEDVVCRYRNTDFLHTALEGGWVRLDGRAG